MMRIPPNKLSDARHGFTLVELLVVIAVLALLVALLLPAVQAAREAARRVQCMNHVRQLALAAIAHEESLGFYPSGGWGYFTDGDPDRGFGREQPGGWTFSVLPFLEEQHLFDLASDGQPDRITEEQREGMRRVTETALPVLYCPSRRPARPYAQGWRSGPQERRYVNPAPVVGKNDYAASVGGCCNNYGTLGGCTDRLGYPLPRCPDIAEKTSWPLSPFSTRHNRMFNGVIFGGSEVGARHVLDGTSKTYLIGEKAVRPEASQVIDPEQINGLFPDRASGHGTHLLWRLDWGNSPAWTAAGPVTLRNGILRPRRDDVVCRLPPYHPRPCHPYARFGSAHAHSFHMAFCDGSVRPIEYTIDPVVHLANSNRHDGWVEGEPLDVTDFYERDPL